VTAPLAAAGTVPTRETAQGHPIQDVVYFRHTANGPMGPVILWFGSASSGFYKRKPVVVNRHAQFYMSIRSSGESLLVWRGVYRLYSDTRVPVIDVNMLRAD